MSTTRNTVDVAILGMFAAITVVLQLLSYAVKIGTFNLSLVLIPIVLVSVLYGPKQGAIIGAVFGVIVTIASATGLDLGGNVLFLSSPVLTTLVCIGKGAFAGFFAGLVAHPIKSKNVYLAVILAAIIAPITNTGLFVLSMFAFFRDTLTVWADGADVVYYAIVGLIGINFVIELFINLVLSPVVLRVTKAFSKK